MKRRWGRWRGYADELEEVMRVAGGHLAEAEALIAESWERSSWHARQRDSIDHEILRRALDTPFLRELIEIAWREGAETQRESADFSGRPWRLGETQTQLGSTERAFDESRLEPGERAPADKPPARLRAVERALGERSRSLVVLLDNLVSARNASAVVRTAEALGLQEVHLIQQEGRLELERTITMRSERWLDLFWYQEPLEAAKALRARGYKLLVSDFSSEALPLAEVSLDDEVVLAFGSEQVGVSEELKGEADGFFYIPCVGFTSYINVSVAAGIAIHAIDDRMRREGRRKLLSEDEKAQLRRTWYAALARGDAARAREYLAWLDDPPKPAEKSRHSRPIADS